MGRVRVVAHLLVLLVLATVVVSSRAVASTAAPSEYLAALFGPEASRAEFAALYAHVVEKRRSETFVPAAEPLALPATAITHAARATDCVDGVTLFSEHQVNDTLVGASLTDALSRSFFFFDRGCFARTCNARPTTAQAWGFAVAAAAIITLVSFVGVMLLPLGGSLTPVLLPPLVAFGFGAISGDAVFHIMPYLYALHTHGESPFTNDANKWAWLVAVVFPACIIFSLVEFAILWIFARRTPEQRKRAQAPSDGSLNLHAISSVGWMNLISDGVHNFVDGLALGAAWSTSISLGLGTSLAIFFHEIPQEIADFSILVRSGFPRWWALLFNLLSGLPCLVGVLIAVPISTGAQEAQYWVLAVTAGGFFYIAWTLLLAELTDERGAAMLLAMVVAMLLGFVALILIAVYEDAMLFGVFCVA